MDEPLREKREKKLHLFSLSHVDVRDKADH